MKKLLLLFLLSCGLSSLALAQCPHHGHCAQSSSCSKAAADSLQTFVVDGVVVTQEQLRTIDPADVDSIRILRTDKVNPSSHATYFIYTKSKPFVKKEEEANSTDKKEKK